MKKIVTLIIIVLTTIVLYSYSYTNDEDIFDKNQIVDTKWQLSEYISSDYAVYIYFKHDNTFWHYVYYTNGNKPDSSLICYWDIHDNKIFLTCYDVNISVKDTTIHNNIDTLKQIPDYDINNRIYRKSLKVLFCNNTSLTLYDISTNKAVQYHKNF